MRGDVYEIGIDLPGEPRSGLRHFAFVVSSEEYTSQTGLVTVISSSLGSTAQVRFPFACFLDDAGIYHAERGREFDTTRPVTATLIATREASRLPPRSGRVDERFFSGQGCRRGFGALDLLAVQLQLPGRMASLAKVFGTPRDVAAGGRPCAVPRLSVWSVCGSATPWLVVSNETYNSVTAHVQGIELREPGGSGNPGAGTLPTPAGPRRLGPSIKVLKKPARGVAVADQLTERLGDLDASHSADVDEYLAFLFATS